MRTYLKRSTASRDSIRSGSGPSAVGDDRRGSVLLVVIGLLGMLLLVGIAFYSFAGQEQASSQYYAEAAKEDEGGLSPEKLWSFALDQLILGTVDNNKQHSALWGRRHALLTGVLGRTGTTNFDGFDLTPFNGAGINLQYDTTMGYVGDPFVDQDFDGTPDGSQTLLNFNYSPAANNGVAPTVPTAPAPDVDYTAPDINTLPLAFVGRGMNTFGADVSVMTPSFHRPQLLRSSGIPIPNWQTNPVTAQRILRPHPNHKALAYDTATSSWYQSPSGVNRFLSAPGTNALGQTVNAFPFGTAATLKQGVWDLSAPPGGAISYAWDADNDGDGIKEGIWMDLDFPVQSLADGRKYVPLFSFTVLDADGLINLNVSGNQSGFNNLGIPLASGRHVSSSNQGLSRAEISPEWAMYANPLSDPASTVQHNLFWGAPTGTISRTEMANIETLFLNMGRPEFSDKPSGTYTFPGSATLYEPTKYYPGRYGELELMAPNNLSNNGIAGYGRGATMNRDFTYMPQPGRSNQLFPGYGDDDSDNQQGHARLDNAGYFFMGDSFLRQQSNVNTPSYIHPLDFFGDGVGVQAGTTGLKTYLNNSGLPTPAQWPYYAYRYSSPGDATAYGFYNYLNAGAGSALLPSASAHSAQFDEADEIIAEFELATTNTTMLQDEILGPDSMLELQGTDADLTTATLQGRVRDLAPFNFKQSAQAEAIRHQFTVLSHDRKNFGLPPAYRRSWEFNRDSDSDGNMEFPPAFLSPAGGGANEPFRQVLAQLLHVEYNQSTSTTVLAQLRLNLNRLLTGFDTTNGPIGAPVYRELTPHPVTLLGNAPIVTPTWNADTPSGTPSPNDQEWWARYDRQRMARDIYVLLYTLGGGMDATNYATTSNTGNTLYSNAQLKEMAQFAVNVVDELDRDDVITKFEYDKNLQDGWSLDDNAYNSLSDTENTLPDRGVVYGVEAQKLTLSEVLGIISRRVSSGPMTYTDHIATQVNDSEGSSDRYYTFMELRNASPFYVDLTSGAWQIAVQDDPDGTPNTGDETDRVELTLFSGNAISSIAPGALFTIGNRGGPPALDPNIAAQNLPSIFKVDTTGAATPDFTSPTTWIAPSSGALDLDLIPQTAGSPSNTAQFLVTNGSGSSTVVGAGSDVTTAGNFLFGGAGGNVSAAQEAASHTFVLRRRAHLTRAIPVSYSSNSTNHNNQSVDNPWIEVDRIVMPAWRVFSLAQSDMMTDVQNKLGPLTSWERSQPFARNQAGGEAAHAPATGTPNWSANTISAGNSLYTGSFTQYQLHYDRDFASPIDLLAVPLYGPDEVTRRVGQTAKFNRNVTPASLAADNSSFLAQERFLRPQHYDNMSAGVPAGTIPSAATAVTDIINNRWYRLLGHVDVPTQSQQGLHTYPYALRNSGAINLNTVRHRGVLAGLIDDPDNPSSGATLEGHHTPDYGSEVNMLIDQYEPTGIGVNKRDWWLQFLYARDGVDPVTGLILPGTPQGRPFRSLGYSERSSNSLEDTVLRSLPADVAAAGGAPLPYSDRRGLFEARTSGDRLSSGGGDAVDASARHRLLRKVYNNSTTRSNVFVVWISTRFFEAIETPNTGEIQIGDVMQGTSDHRGFFVIDRSLPEQAYSTNTGKFDFRKFVQYRKTIQ